MIHVCKRYGSRDRVIRVFAFDQQIGNALCMLRDHSGRLYLDECRMYELAAIHDDAEGTYADVGLQLSFRAEVVIDFNTDVPLPWPL